MGVIDLALFPPTFAGQATEFFECGGESTFGADLFDMHRECITWGPGDITQAHTYDEHVDLSAAGEGLDVRVGAARNVLSGDLD